MRTKSTKKPKNPTVSKLKKTLDKVFSEYVRRKYVVNGYVACYTCGRTMTWKQIQNGHLVSRYHLSTRFDERNCRPQCVVCNLWRHGMTPVFADNLERELGAGIVAELYALARKPEIDFPYQEKIAYYKEKLSTLPVDDPQNEV